MDENNSIIRLYVDSTGEVKVEVRFQDETVWLTQKAIAELFETTKQNISLHLKNIFESQELTEDSVVKVFLTTAQDGKNYKTNFYNLDAIISVGYRVNSEKATRFRQWATKTLREFIIKGFVLDSERLKKGTNLGKDYFDELLEKIREIRASERRFYQKITDIYKECSIDYDRSSEITKTFYATVQNKLHFAITGNTAAEIIFHRVDKDKKHMGLTSWKNSPEGKILKSDVTIAKNYLDEKELKALNRAVAAYLDIAEMQAENHKAMTMKEWAEKLDAFIKMSGYEVLEHAGKIKHELAKEKAESEYAEFRKIQDVEYLSDFDKEIKRLTEDDEEE